MAWRLLFKRLRSSVSDDGEEDRVEEEPLDEEEDAAACENIDEFNSINVSDGIEDIIDNDIFDE